MGKGIVAFGGKKPAMCLPHWLMMRVGKVIDLMIKWTGKGPDYLTPYKVRWRLDFGCRLTFLPLD